MGTNRLLLAGLTGCLVSAVAGCGGAAGRKEPPARASFSDDEELELAAAAKPKPASGTAAPAANQAAPQAPSPQAGGASLAPEGSTPTPQRSPADDGVVPAPMPVVVLPESLASWTEDDFHVARRQRDPRLLAALRSWAGVESTQSQCVTIARSLLICPKSTGAAPSADALVLNEGFPNDLAREIPQLLAGLSTTESLALMQTILEGTLTTDLPEDVLCRSTISALVAHYDARTEPLLYRLITSAEEIRPDGRGTVRAAALQQQALLELSSLSAPQLRVLLARYATDPKTPPDRQSRLMQHLLAPRVDNLEAQVYLYGSEAGGGARGKLEGTLAAYSEFCIDHLLDIPTTNPVAPLGDLESVDPESGSVETANTGWTPAHLELAARSLWSSRAAAAVRLRLSEEQRPFESGKLMPLAMSLPLPEVRREIHSLLDRQWIEYGVELFQASGRLTQPHDPGMLLVFKTMPRMQHPNKKKKPQVSLEPEGESTASEAAKRSLKERRAKYAWQEIVERQVDAWAQRLYTAAIARERRLQSERAPGDLATVSAGARAEAGTPDELPLSLGLKLHNAADVEAEYHTAWPEHAPECLLQVEVEPLRLHYVRLESEAALGSVVKFYQRQLKKCEERSLHRGQWVDHLTRVEASGRIRSTDVLVRRHVDETQAAPGKKEKLRIEIVVVEAPDVVSSADSRQAATRHDR